MNRFRSLRPLFSLALLWLAASMLVSTIKTSIIGMSDVPFLPIAILPMMLAYLLGFGSWPARRCWIFILSFGTFLTFLEASRSAHAAWQIFIHLPSFEINALFAFITRQSLDLSLFQIQGEEILNHLGVFFMGLQAGSLDQNMLVIEIFWEIPLFLASAWSGWWSSRRNSILIALVPSLAMQVFLLNYAERQRGLTLQLGVFTLILLMSLHQKWSLSKSESKTQARVRTQTYARVFILSAVLATAAGWAPIVPAPAKPVKTPKAEEKIKETIENKVAQSNRGPAPGLPRDHRITVPPQNLMNVVFLANTGEKPLAHEMERDMEPVAPGYYWRWITYDLYDGKTWGSSPTTRASYSTNQALFNFNATGYRVIHQTIIKASTADNHLYWTGALMRTDQPMEATWRVWPSQEDPILHMDMLGSLIKTQQYSVDSLVPQFNEAQLRAASQVYPAEILEKYLALPRNVSQRVRDLAVQLTYQAQNPYDKAKAIEAYLRTFPYTLDVPALPANKEEIADYFLFDLRTGYCEYYATSMVVLARTVGLPARIVMGYASHEYNATNAQYIVREANAHSWVEIYFPNIGWVEFEPTANQPLIEQSAPVEDPNISILLESASKRNKGFMYKKHGYFLPRSPLPAMLLLVFSGIAICVSYLYMQGLSFSYKTIGAMYQHVYRHGRKIAPEISPNTTPSLFAETLKTKLSSDRPFLLPAGDELDQLTSLYLQETYSPHPVTAFEQEQAVRIWYRLFWRLLYIRTILLLPVSLRTK